MNSVRVIILLFIAFASFAAADVELGTATYSLSSSLKFISSAWQTNLEIYADPAVQQVTVSVAVEGLDTSVYDIPALSDVLGQAGSVLTLSVPSTSSIQSAGTRPSFNFTFLALIAVALSLLLGKQRAATNHLSLTLGLVMLICACGLVSSDVRATNPVYHVTIRVPSTATLSFDLSLSAASSSINIHDITVAALSTTSYGFTASAISLTSTAVVNVTALDSAAFASGEFAGSYSVQGASVTFVGDVCSDEVASASVHAGSCTPSYSTHNNTFTLWAENTAAVYFGKSNTPTPSPSSAPTSPPTSTPTSSPSSTPDTKPTKAPTSSPTSAPTSAPTSKPTKAPTAGPTSTPTSTPTSAPTQPPADSTYGFYSAYPIVNFIDAVSGPITGGENNLGTYLSVFGTGFGPAGGIGTTTKVLIGGVEVANYRYYGLSCTGAKLGLAQITVQIGNLQGLTLGTAYPVTVVVNGVSSNTDIMFTPNPGRVWFVSLTGNDATATANDITRPWRHLQLDADEALMSVLRAGDHVIIRGGYWSDVNTFDTAWIRFFTPQQTGTEPTGASVSGWIHFTAYPGPINGNAIEKVQSYTAANMTGGFQGANDARKGTTGNYISMSNMHFAVDPWGNRDAAPANIQYSTGPWRIINNELGPWPSVTHVRSGAVSGANCQKCVVMGNHMHDIDGDPAWLENHGMYIDSGANDWEVAYNWLYNISGGNGIQFFDSAGIAGSKTWVGYTGMKVHHNWIESVGKYALNLADGSKEIEVWNNVVIGGAFAGIRFNSMLGSGLNLTIAFNTFYDNNRQYEYVQAQVLNTGLINGVINMANNIIAVGPTTRQDSTYYDNNGGGDSGLKFKNNLWYDNGRGWGNFTRDTMGTNANPKFNDPSSNDFTLKAGSPALNKGTVAVPIVITNDFTRVMLRPQGAADDLGAYERASN